MPELRTELWLPLALDDVFSFFAEARNLESITPPWLRFRMLTPSPVEMRPGALIDYRLRLHGVPIRWQSEIAVWDPPRRFVDVQRKGPYRRWVHEHRFREADSGTVVEDVVDYEAPGGSLVDRLFVRRDLDRIFAFRRKAISRLLVPEG